MKILCVSDQIDPLICTNSLNERCGDVDFVLSAGDLPKVYHDFIVSSLKKPLFFVLGDNYTDNFMNTNEPASSLTGSAHIDEKVCSDRGLIIAGLGGSVKNAKYNQGENQFSDFRMNIKILKMIPQLIWNRLFRGRFLDVLLTHAPPRGINDKNDKNDEFHRGFKGFLWFMRVFKPTCLVHGHIHLYNLSETRATKYHNTLVVNAFGHYFINLSTGGGHSLSGNGHFPVGKHSNVYV
jgi:Icc-related predicted phosphoesterase